MVLRSKCQFLQNMQGKRKKIQKRCLVSFAVQQIKQNRLCYPSQHTNEDEVTVLVNSYPFSLQSSHDKITILKKRKQ